MRIATLLISIAAGLLAGAAAVQRPLGPTPVVVELFTSQGCSSCPPADALIRQIARDSSLHGRVIPLAFHVDYWDNLGWRDPFSSADWSRRQMVYARSFRLNSAYTPQVVVNGARQFVGSSASNMSAALHEASGAKAVGSVTLDVAKDGSKINASVRADVPANSDVFVVIFEDDVSTRIEGGENGGRTTTEDAIVRRMLRLGTGSLTKTVTLLTVPSWKHLGVVAFAQDRSTLAISAAAVRYVK